MMQGAFGNPKMQIYIAPTWSSLKTRHVSAVGFTSRFAEVDGLMLG